MRARRRRARGVTEATFHPERGAAAAACMIALLPAPRTRRRRATGRRPIARSAPDAMSRPIPSTRAGCERATGPVQLNRVTAHALRGLGPTRPSRTSHAWRSAPTRGREAQYNLGTVFGQRNDYRPGLARLRRVLERNPADRTPGGTTRCSTAAASSRAIPILRRRRSRPSRSLREGAEAEARSPASNSRNRRPRRPDNRSKRLRLPDADSRG